MRKLLIVFLLLQVLDLITTLIGLRQGGTELNPLVMWLTHMQIMPMIVLKLVGCTMGYLLYSLGKRWMLQFVVGAFTLIVLWNSFWVVRGFVG